VGFIWPHNSTPSQRVINLAQLHGEIDMENELDDIKESLQTTNQNLVFIARVLESFRMCVVVLLTVIIIVLLFF